MRTRRVSSRTARPSRSSVRTAHCFRDGSARRTMAASPSPKELVNIHAEKDIKSVVENSEESIVKNERYTKIGGDDTRVVVGTQNIDAGSQFVTVKKTSLHYKMPLCSEAVR